MPSRTIGEAVAEATGVLRSGGVEEARLDAEVILAFLLKMSRTELYLKTGSRIEDRVLEEYFAMIGRRAQHEPVAYITGEKEFMSLTFSVNRAVLIPRPETELVVEEALAIKPLRVIDVGTGSGAIAVSLAHYLPECRVWAVDVSAEALEVAGLNARRCGVDRRITFLRGNLLDPLDSPEFTDSFDVIAANLPYIPAREMDNLPLDVVGFEPHTALDGGDDGLRCYREMCPAAAGLLKTGGALLTEIGFNQAGAMRDLLENAGFSGVEVIKDLARFDRVVKAVKT